MALQRKKSQFFGVQYSSDQNQTIRTTVMAGYGGQNFNYPNYDPAYDDYPTQRPYPHPGTSGLQYGGDGLEYPAAEGKGI